MTSRRPSSSAGPAALRSSVPRSIDTRPSGWTRIWSLGPGVAAGLASVVGAGLIAVPAAVLHETGDAAALTWIIAASACLPMLMLFRDTVIVSGYSADPLRETIRTGLGRRPAAMVPLMFSMVVAVGLPSGSVMAARNLTAIMHLDVPEIGIAALLMTFAVVVNLLGRSLGSTVERIGTVILVVGIVGVAASSLLHPTRTLTVVPDVPELGLIPAGALIAFWAFIGFENLTFLARELPDPRRDFAPVAIISLALILILVLALTFAVQVQTPLVDPVTGIVDALRSTPWGGAAASVVAAMGILAITLNAVAWTRGVSTVISAAAAERILPRSLAVGTGATPRRAVLVLSVGFAVSLVILLLKPDLVVDMIGAASGVFVIIYIMCIIAYIRTVGLRVWSTANLALIPLMAWSLISSGPRAIFPVAVFLVTGALAFIRARSRARSGSDSGSAPGSTTGSAPGSPA